MDTDTLEQLIERSETFDQNKHDFKVKPSEAGFQGGRFVTTSMFGQRTYYSVEDYALGQAATHLNVPVGYLRRCPTQLQDTNLNHWLWSQRGERGKDRPWLIRTDSDRVRSFLSDVYAPIGNTDILTIASELLQQNNYKLIRPNLTRDDLHLRVVVIDDVGPDGNYGLGAYIQNGEIGNRMLSVAPFLMRTSCTNSTVWMKHAWEQRHAHVSTAYLRASLKEHLGRAFAVADTMLENVIKAEEDRIPDLNKVIKELAAKHKLSDDQRTLIQLGSENNWSRMGLVNGLTFMAQRLDDYDEELKIEALAGEILGGGRW